MIVSIYSILFIVDSRMSGNVAVVLFVCVCVLLLYMSAVYVVVCLYFIYVFM